MTDKVGRAIAAMQGFGSKVCKVVRKLLKVIVRSRTEGVAQEA
jgi:hypothetical protein